MSMLMACDQREAADRFTEWRDHHDPTAKFAFLMALLGGSDAPMSCPWDTEHPVVYATMTSVVIDDHVFEVVGPQARGEFTGALLACNEPEAARHFNGWRGSRVAVNVSAATVFGLVYTPEAALGAGFFKQTMVRDLIGVSESRSTGITGS